MDDRLHLRAAGRFCRSKSSAFCCILLAAALLVLLYLFLRDGLAVLAEGLISRLFLDAFH